jgi:hypothetical protein
MITLFCRGERLLIAEHDAEKGRAQGRAAP